MGWQDSLLDASFRGVTFDCQRTQDAIQNDIAMHEYPYLHGGDVEDLGRKARRIVMTAVFFGDDYGDRLAALTKALKQLGPGELIHPIFGRVDAQIADFQVLHDAETPDYCTVELNFVTATPGNPFFVQQLPAQKAEVVSQLAAAAHFNGIESFARALSLLKGIKGNLSRLNALRNVLTGTLGAIRSQVQGVITTVLDVIDYPRAFAGDVMSLVSGMVDLRGFDVGVITSDWKSLVGQFDNVVKLPAKVSAGSRSTGDNSGSGGVAADAKPIPARAEDIALVTALLQIAAATALAETAGQILAAEAEQPTLSPREVEQIAGDVRDTLQQAITAYRDLFPVEDARPVTEALKDTALAVQEAAVAVIVLHPPLLTRRVEAPGNLHLIAFRWYGDYTRAQELARLNPQLTNPNALQAGDTLYAYAR